LGRYFFSLLGTIPQAILFLEAEVIKLLTGNSSALNNFAELFLKIETGQLFSLATIELLKEVAVVLPC
jgi:hypothetical protein